MFTAQYSATQMNTKINEVQKQIATKKKVPAYLYHGADEHFC